MFAFTVAVALWACAPAQPSTVAEPAASFTVTVAPVQPATAQQTAAAVVSAEADPPTQTTATAARVPTLRLREPTVGPSYPPELIKRVLRRSKPGFRECAGEAQGSSPRGTLTFIIETDGRVKEAAYKNGDAVIAPSRPQQCVLDAILVMEFVPPPSRLTVSFP